MKAISIRFQWMRFGWSLLSAIFLNGLDVFAQTPNPVATPSYEDMVPVNVPGHPFYIDIFETPCQRAEQTLGTQLQMGRPSCEWKPARMTYQQGIAYCLGVNKRLPTIDEWRAAASNLGHNRNFTLQGDRIRRDTNLAFGPENVIPNILNHFGQSGRITDPNQLGIDGIGTVGLTGNRTEWVIGPNSNPAQCGHGYEPVLSEDDYRLPNLCTSNPASFEHRPDVANDSPNGTIRCVVDFPNGQPATLTYSDHVRNSPALAQAVNHPTLQPANGFVMTHLATTLAPNPRSGAPGMDGSAPAHGAPLSGATTTAPTGPPGGLSGLLIRNNPDARLPVNGRNRLGRRPPRYGPNEKQRTEFEETWVEKKDPDDSDAGLEPPTESLDIE